MAPEYKFTYFNTTGLGESIRMLFRYGGIEFEDNRIEKADWPKLKDTMIFGQIPMLEYKGKRYHQSNSIARCIAKKVHLAGNDELEALEIDAMVDTITDFRLQVTAFANEKNEKVKENMKGPLFTETYPRYFKHLDQFAADNNGYLVLGKLTWADFILVGILEAFKARVGLDMAANYPNLKAVEKHVLDLPAIQEWIKIRPKCD